MMSLEWDEGSNALLNEQVLGPDGVFVDNDFAEGRAEARLTRADHVRQRDEALVHRQGDLRPTDRRLAVRVSHDRGLDLGQGRRLSRRTSSRSWRCRGARRTPTRRRSTRLCRPSPTRGCPDAQEFVDNQISGLSSVLSILYVLLALSVLVSFFGIINTLILTVFERTREIGMLRAIG